MKVLLSASGVYLAELFDTQSRSTGITLARTSSDPIGGLTRLIATALLAWLGAYLSVALFLLIFVLIGLVSVYLGRETHDAAFESDPAPVLVEESRADADRLFRRPRRWRSGCGPRQPATGRMRAEREVAEADARGRAIADPYGFAPRHAGTAGLTQPAAPAARNGFGLAAAIIAPVGILFGLVPLTGFIAVICALVAIPLALVGWSRVRKGMATNGTTAMTGLLLGAGALALGVWGITIVFGAVDQLAEDLSSPAPIAAPPVPGPDGQQPAIEAERPAGAAAPAVAAFGQRVTFDDGLAVEVAAPQPYKPSRYAASHDGDHAITF
ncbi:hypothetical protein K1T35_34575 [Pseudonocardia sp. DSM 110487]|uniref:hypothetical protein n=1 Tax=Pseudonocardia sp. DSM 110487 TaxID=2865833 RepID=UPI001C6A0952|nr:hypothetical protein [Pseudonocardia sp. DSM 110487]QYN33580.1 hypothetical protein K1T35_34575 [Pseudonocardia sp. DSM 110487]